MGFDDFAEELGKLKQLHEDDTRPQLGKGGDPVTWLEIYDQRLSVENNDVFIDKCTPVGSYLIWDHPGSTWGSWDNGSWATQSTAGASPEFDCVRFKEFSIHQTYDEDFDDTTYKDTGVTTAVWSSVGSLNFEAGSTIAQSLKVLGSDVQLGSINRITLSIEGSNTSSLSGSVTADGGTTWHPVEFGFEKTITIGLGSDVRWRIVSTL